MLVTELLDERRRTRLALFATVLPSLLITQACTPPPTSTDAGPKPGVHDAGPEPSALDIPAGAAGCELLLEETAGPVRVTFGEGTRGTSVREAPRVAVAAVASPGALAIEVAGAFSLASSRCVDAAGLDVGAVEVTR